jgi:hypothetical protein
MPQKKRDPERIKQIIKEIRQGSIDPGKVDKIEKEKKKNK